MDPILFSPFELKSVKLRNRIIMSPMCQYSASEGLANDWYLARYGSRAVRGAVLIVQETTAVCQDGRITGQKGSISPDWESARGLKPGQGGWQTVAPSAIPYSDPRE